MVKGDLSPVKEYHFPVMWRTSVFLRQVCKLVLHIIKGEILLAKKDRTNENCVERVHTCVHAHMSMYVHAQAHEDVCAGMCTCVSMHVCFCACVLLGGTFARLLWLHPQGP